MLELHGAWRGPAPAGELRLRRRSDGLALASRSLVGAGIGSAPPSRSPRCATRAPSLEALATGAPGAHERWDLTLGALPLRLPAPLGGIEWGGAATT